MVSALPPRYTKTLVLPPAESQAAGGFKWRDDDYFKSHGKQYQAGWFEEEMRKTKKIETLADLQAVGWTRKSVPFAGTTKFDSNGRPMTQPARPLTDLGGRAQQSTLLSSRSDASSRPSTVALGGLRRRAPAVLDPMNGGEFGGRNWPGSPGQVGSPGQAMQRSTSSPAMSSRSGAGRDIYSGAHGDGRSLSPAGNGGRAPRTPTLALPGKLLDTTNEFYGSRAAEADAPPSDYRKQRLLRTNSDIWALGTLPKATA